MNLPPLMKETFLMLRSHIMSVSCTEEPFTRMWRKGSHECCLGFSSFCSAALTPKPWRRTEIRLKSLKERLERPGDGEKCGERLKETTKQTEECFKRQGAEIRDLMALSSLR